MQKIYIALLGLFVALLCAQPALPQAQYNNIKTFGAIGDGNSHPVSQFYSSLAAAQMVFPWLDDTTQEMDWVGTQAAIDYGYSHGNQNTFCPNVAIQNAAYQLSLPLYVDAPENYRARGAIVRWSSGLSYPYEAEIQYNGLAWTSLGSNNIGNPPTVTSGYPATITIPATQAGPAASNLPFADVTITNAAPAVIGLAGHGLIAGTPLRFLASVQNGVFTGSISGTTLTVPANNKNTGSIYNGEGITGTGITAGTRIVSGGPASAAGGGTFTIAPSQTVASTAMTTFAAPAGINPNQIYYIVSPATNTFEISATRGGGAINTLTAGATGTPAPVVFGISTQVWGIDPNPPGNRSFADRSNFIGDDGLPSNLGCRFLSLSPTGPAFLVGPNNGDLIKGVVVAGPSASNDYRCQRPNPDVSSGAGFNLGDVVPMIGLGVITNGAGSRTTFDNVGSSNFYFGFQNGFAGGNLGDFNDFTKPSILENCVGFYWSQDQGFINAIYDGVVFNNTTMVNNNLVAELNIVGGNYSSTYNQGGSYAVTGVTVNLDTITMTVTTPDRYLLHPLCGLNNQCAVTDWAMVTAHFGIVPFKLVGFNPFTKLLTLTYNTTWLNPWSDTGLDNQAALATDIQAVTTVYASETITKFVGTGMTISQTHLEDGIAPLTWLVNVAGFGGGKPNIIQSTYFNGNITGTTNLVQPSSSCAPSTACYQNILAAWYVQQNNPFIVMSGNDAIIDGASGGSDVIPERSLIAQSVGGLLEMRHTVGIGLNTANNILWEFRGSTAHGSTAFTGTASNAAVPYTRDSVNALGAGLFDTGVTFLPTFPTIGATAPANIASDSSWRGSGWGQSPFWGLRPAPWSSPCITPAQATVLAGALPAITYTASLAGHTPGIPYVPAGLSITAAGTGYHVNDSVPLVGVGGTTNSAASIVVDTVGGSGQILTFTTTGSGSFSPAPTSFTSGTPSPPGGSGATFGTPSYDVLPVVVGYPLLWGGSLYHKCDWNGSTQTKYALLSTNTGWSYFQNFTSTNLPNASWSVMGGSPFVYFSREFLEVAVPGLVVSLVGSGSCTGTTAIAMITEIHLQAGYAATVNAAQDGPPSIIPFPAGVVCSGTVITQAPPNIVNPY